MVGRASPELPGRAALWRQDTLGLGQLEVSVVLGDDDPGSVTSLVTQLKRRQLPAHLQDCLQHEEVIGVGVHGQKVKLLLDTKLFEQIQDVVRVEYNLEISHQTVFL